MEIHGKLVDIHNKTIFAATITVEEGRIVDIRRNSHRGGLFILPGLVDAHLHLESTLIPPSEFARIAVRHGTLGAICNPNAIAAASGPPGIRWMLENSAKIPFNFHFSAPASVATLDAQEVQRLLRHPSVCCLGELTYFPLIANDSEMLEKIASANELGKPIDGDAPGLFGEALKEYCALGATTDHKSATLSEAREKHSLGMKILVRGGSVAPNFQTLFPLLREDPEACMLCTGYLEPDQLILGHINLLVRQAVEWGMDPIDAIISATKTPVKHYKLDMGLLREGDRADFILVENLETFRLIEAYIDGNPVFKQESLIPRIQLQPWKSPSWDPKKGHDFPLTIRDGSIRIVEAAHETSPAGRASTHPVASEQLAIDPARDLLKLVSINCGQQSDPEVGLIKRFGLKKGAVASSNSHRPPQIIGIGAADSDLANAIDAIIAAQGGLAVSYQGRTDLLPLPIAGLISTLAAEEVALRYSNLQLAAKELGCTRSSPFMSLGELR